MTKCANEVYNDYLRTYLMLIFEIICNRSLILTQFRVDKIDDSWDGSLSIGGVPCLPTEGVPECAMRLDPPAWILSSDLQYNGTNVSVKKFLYLFFNKTIDGSFFFLLFSILSFWFFVLV